MAMLLSENRTGSQELGMEESHMLWRGDKGLRTAGLMARREVHTVMGETKRKPRSDHALPTARRMAWREVHTVKATISAKNRWLVLLTTVLAVLCLFTTETTPASANTTLSGTATASGTFTRTNEYDWRLSKSVLPARATIARESKQTFTYTLRACRTQTSTETFGARGQICVTNGGGQATVGLTIRAKVQRRLGTGPWQDVPGAVIQPIQSALGPGETRCFDYSITFGFVVGAQHRVVALPTILNHSGSLGTPKGPELRAYFTLPRVASQVDSGDAAASVTDALPAVSCSGFSVDGGLAAPWNIQPSDLDAKGCATRLFTVDVTNGKDVANTPECGVRNASGTLIPTVRNFAPCSSTCSLSNTARLTESTTGEQQTANAPATITTPALAETLLSCLDENAIRAALIGKDPALQANYLNDLLCKINALRPAGKKLARVAFLDTLAQNHSRALIASQFNSAEPGAHALGGNLCQQARNAGYIAPEDVCFITENLAVGKWKPGDVFTAWQQSGSHNANMIDDRFNHVGLALAVQYGCDAGGNLQPKIWWVVKFGRSDRVQGVEPPCPISYADNTDGRVQEIRNLLALADQALCAGDPCNFDTVYRNFVSAWRRFELPECPTDKFQECLDGVLPHRSWSPGAWSPIITSPG
jgi:uncharacterized protein YkwD